MSARKLQVWTWVIASGALLAVLALTVR